MCCSPGAWTGPDWEGTDAQQVQGSTWELDELSAEVCYFTLIKPPKSKSAIVAKVPELCDGYFNKAHDPKRSLL